MRVHDVFDQCSLHDRIEAPSGILTPSGWGKARPVATALSAIFLDINLTSKRRSSTLFNNESVWSRFIFLSNFISRWSKGALKSQSWSDAKTKEEDLPNNIKVTFRHFWTIERRLKKALAFVKSYAAVVNEYITASNARPVDRKWPTTRGHIWYRIMKSPRSASPEKS